MGTFWRLWRRFVEVVWPEPVQVAQRLHQLRRSIEAEIERRIVTETFAAGNREEAERARAAGEQVVWHCEPDACPECGDHCGEVGGHDLPPVHPNCRCVVLGERVSAKF